MGLVGMLIGIAIIGGLWWLTMLLYYVARVKRANAKYKIEVITVGISICISLAVKLIILCVTNSDVLANIDKGIGAFFAALYQAIGGLAFEGLGDANVSAALQCLYTGSSVYAGLVFLSIITAKANYEIYSLVRLRSCEKNKSVYVFTALTEDALTLAKSIREQHVKENTKCKIVFGGNELPAFDGKDELCRQVMSEGFLYWSYAKSDKKGKNSTRKKSIAKSLWLNNKNKDNYNLRFIVFALALDESGLPKEEENMETVFNDAQARLGADDGLRIEYVILTKREINYEAYERKNRELLYEFCLAQRDECGGGNVAKALKTLEEKGSYQEFRQYLMKSENQRFIDSNGDAQMQSRYADYKAVKNALNKQFFSRIIIDVWNEAIVSSRSAVARILEEKVEEYVKQRKEKLTVWSLGFGETAQAIVNQLYSQTAFIDSNFTTNALTRNQGQVMANLPFKFIVEAFDTNMKDISGSFQASHPLYVCIDDVDELIKDEYEKIGKYIAKALPKVQFTDAEVKPTSFADKNDDDKLTLLLPSVRRYLMHKKAAERMKGVLAQYSGRYPDGYVNVDGEKNQKLNHRTYDRLKHEKEMAFPVFRCNSISCLNTAFYEYIDRITGKPTDNGRDAQAYLKKLEEKAGDEVKKALEGACKYASPTRPDVIVIAMGSDFSNIKIANALINDICNEWHNDGNQSSAEHNQVIVVNIRDKRNNDLLINANAPWEGNVLRMRHVTVIIAGNTDELYTYNQMVDHSEDAEYNYIYERIRELLAYYEDAINKIAKEYTQAMSRAVAAMSVKGQAEKTAAQWISTSCLSLVGKPVKAEQKQAENEKAVLLAVELISAFEGKSGGVEPYLNAATAALADKTDTVASVFCQWLEQAKALLTEKEFNTAAFSTLFNEFRNKLTQSTWSLISNCLTNICEAIRLANTDYVTKESFKQDAPLLVAWVKEISAILLSANKDGELKVLETALIDNIGPAYVSSDIDLFISSIRKSLAIDDSTLAAKEKDWFERDMWLKESNRNSRLFKPVFEQLYRSISGDDVQVAIGIAKLAMLEHHRWNRHHIANGWAYQTAAKKDELLKRHYCLTPYCLVPTNSSQYDLVNVVRAIIGCPEVQPQTEVLEQKAQL